MVQKCPFSVLKTFSYEKYTSWGYYYRNIYFLWKNSFFWEKLIKNLVTVLLSLNTSFERWGENRGPVNFEHPWCRVRRLEQELHGLELFQGNGALTTVVPIKRCQCFWTLNFLDHYCFNLISFKSSSKFYPVIANNWINQDFAIN